MPTLSSLFGQDSAVRVLRKALESEHLAGTYLILGPQGTGKGTLARAFAQAAACLSPRHDPFDACGTCDSCRRAEAGFHPDIVSIPPAGEQTQIWQFWEREGKPGSGALSRTMNYAPTIGKRRVYIIERADTLNESAANSILKVLEEPPPYALFVLLAPQAARLLPTIVSRSQLLRMRALETGELAAYLRDRVGIEAERAGMLAAYAEGRIGQAMQFAQNAAVAEEINRILDFAETLPDAPRVRALKLAEQIRKIAAQTKALVGEEPAEADGDDGEATGKKEKTGRRQIAAVFDLLVAFYRDLLTLSVTGGDGARLINRERRAHLERLAKHGSPQRWTACLDAILRARRRLDANANVALVTESLTVTLLS